MCAVLGEIWELHLRLAVTKCVYSYAVKVLGSSYQFVEDFFVTDLVLNTMCSAREHRGKFDYAGAVMAAVASDESFLDCISEYTRIGEGPLNLRRYVFGKDSRSLPNLLFCHAHLIFRQSPSHFDGSGKQSTLITIQSVRNFTFVLRENQECDGNQPILWMIYNDHRRRV